jgi:hypothetical protein
MLKLSAALLTLFVTACASVERVPVDLSGQLPPPLTADGIPSDSDLECVSDEAYQKIFKIYQRTLTLESIIESTRRGN